MSLVKQTIERVAKESLEIGLDLLQRRFGLQDFEIQLFSLRLKTNAKEMGFDPANYLFGVYFTSLRLMNWQVSKEILLEADFRTVR